MESLRMGQHGGPAVPCLAGKPGSLSRHFVPSQSARSAACAGIKTKDALPTIACTS